MQKTFLKNLTAALILIMVTVVLDAAEGSSTYAEFFDTPPGDDEMPLVINEAASRNRSLFEDDFGDFSDWAELYNRSEEAVNLKGWFLSDDPGDPYKWAFTRSHMLQPGEHLLVVLSGRDIRLPEDSTNDRSFYHTNFRLNAESGESVVLSDSSGQIVDRISTSRISQNLRRDTSFGRAEDGVFSWRVFSQPTPGQSNTLKLPAPEFAEKSGLFDPTDTVKLNFNPPDLNGVEGLSPDRLVLKYTIQDGMPQSEIGMPSYRSWVYPTNRSGQTFTSSRILEETAVIKARYYLGMTPSPQSEVSYIMEEHSLPVVSLTADPADIWDPEEGIYVIGEDMEEPNYTKEIEIPARLTYLYPEKLQSTKFYPAGQYDDASHGESKDTAAEADGRSENFQQRFMKPDAELRSGSLQADLPVTIRIFGAASRNFPDKSLAVFARDRSLPNIFFKNQSDTLRSLVLRTAATDWPRAHMRDIVSSDFIQPLDTDVQDYSLAVLYLNGEFFGVRNLREKVNEHMIQDQYGVDADRLDLVEGNFVIRTLSGSSSSYAYMLNYITEANMNISRYYERVKDMINIDSFIDYVIFETFINNTDWPANNVKAWRERAPGSLWRWIVYDTDAGYDTEEFWSSEREDSLGFAKGRADYDSIYRVITYESSWHAGSIFRSLMANQEFYDAFIQRYEELIGAENGEITNPDAPLGTKRLLRIINTIETAVEEDMQLHVEKWSAQDFYYMAWSGMSDEVEMIDRWRTQVDVLRSFAEQRPGYAAGFLENLKRVYTPVGKNQISNGSFNQDDADWNLFWSSDVTEQRVVELQGNKVGRVDISSSYSSSDNPAELVAFVHDDISLAEGRSYEFSFSIRGDRELGDTQTALCYLFKHTREYDEYASLAVPISEEWIEVSRRFTMEKTDTDARLQFRLGRLPGGITVYIDDVQLVEVE
ncbi:MAG: CotH kinase family protein [Spirochaetales bacterium]|nr:CotH kinase family protein [Spirochaetales bacterium]